MYGKKEIPSKVALVVCSLFCSSSDHGGSLAWEIDVCVFFLKKDVLCLYDNRICQYIINVRSFLNLAIRIRELQVLKPKKSPPLSLKMDRMSLRVMLITIHLTIAKKITCRKWRLWGEAVEQKRREEKK